MRVAFFGSSRFVLPVLEALDGHTKLRLVVTQPDKPVGRHERMQPAPPKSWALAKNIDVLTPASLSNEQSKVLASLARHQVELILVADYGLLIPKEIFAFPKYQSINIHFSKLPRLRGPSPVQWTILRGDTKAWITFFELAEELDVGPILSQHSYPLSGTETTAPLYEYLFRRAAELLPQFLEDYTRGKLPPKEQNHVQATFTRHLTRDDGFVPWEVLNAAMEGKSVEFKTHLPASIFQLPSSVFVFRMLRAFTPWPGVWTKIRIKNYESRIMEKRLKILKAHNENTHLVLDEVQLEGKKPVSWEEFKRYYL